MLKIGQGRGRRRSGSKDQKPNGSRLSCKERLEHILIGNHGRVRQIRDRTFEESLGVFVGRDKYWEAWWRLWTPRFGWRIGSDTKEGIFAASLQPAGLDCGWVGSGQWTQREFGVWWMAGCCHFSGCRGRTRRFGCGQAILW